MKIVNANWVAGPDGDHGRFEIMFITDDDQPHVAAPSPAAMTALITLTQADTVLLWDPAARTLIAANLIGTMPWTERAHPSAPGREGSDAHASLNKLHRAAAAWLRQQAMAIGPGTI